MDHAYAHGDLSSLFLSDKYADLDIICNGLRFPAHRAVICPKSATLRKFCDIWAAPYPGRVTMGFSHYQPVVVEKCLSIFYRGNYEDVAYETAGTPSSLAYWNGEAAALSLSSVPPYAFDEEDALFARDVNGPCCTYSYFQSVNHYLIKSLSEAQGIYALASQLDFTTGKLLACVRFRRAARELLSRALHYAEGSEYIYKHVSETIGKFYRNPFSNDPCTTNTINGIVAGFMHQPGFFTALKPIMLRHPCIPVDALQLLITGQIRSCRFDLSKAGYSDNARPESGPPKCETGLNRDAALDCASKTRRVANMIAVVSESRAPVVVSSSQAQLVPQTHIAPKLALKAARPSNKGKEKEVVPEAPLSLAQLQRSEGPCAEDGANRARVKQWIRSLCDQYFTRSCESPWTDFRSGTSVEIPDQPQKPVSESPKAVITQGSSAVTIPGIRAKSRYNCFPATGPSENTAGPS